MFRARFNLISIAIAGIILSGSSSFAEKMDKATHTLLIDKLERVLELMDSSSDKRIDVVLRLADLHAERARLEDMEQGQKDADKADLEAKVDRTRSLKLYQDAMKKSTPEIQGKITFQMAQLYDLQGENKKALNLYQNISQNKDNKYRPEYVGEALTKLGDLSFNKVKFSEAQKFFLSALQIKETPRQDYIKYRIAWCEFHNGHLATATKGLIDVLKANVISGQGDSTSFQEEVSRDLATFISRGKASPTEVQTVSDLSPQSVRHQNLIYLSDELNRLGKKNAAVYVVMVAGPSREDNAAGDRDPQHDKIEEHLKLAELQYDIGKKDQVVTELETTVNLWKANSCAVAENCSLLKDRFKRLVVNWGKAEEKHPSVDLVKSYGLYNSLFSDAEMNYWAALAARDTSQFKEAATFYRSAYDIASSQIKGTGKAVPDKKISNIIEGSLLGEIEVSELANNIEMKANAYNHYLEERPNGQKSLEVTYQKAHLLYEQGQYQQAANEFHRIALLNGATELREKAAHLALDSLVLLKSDDLVQSWATEFSREFHEGRGAFIAIAKKAVINHVAIVLNDPNSSPAQLREALNRLAAFPVREATREEQIAYYKNKLILSERLKDLGEMQKAANGLLSMKGISQEDKIYALSRKEWVSELTLNFKDAYQLSLILSGHSNPGERALKLAMLAELAGKNPVRHYEDYLRVGRDREKVQGVVAKMVRLSGSAKTLLQNEASLKSNPDLLATLALEIFAVHQDYNFAKQILKINGIWQTPSGKVLSRFVFLKNYHKFSEELMASHLNHGRNIRSNLDRYISLLKRTEMEVGKAVASQDWVLQAITLNDVAYHYKRFAIELYGMKVPESLSGEVSKQAHLYTAKSAEVSQKIAELWSDSSTIDTLFSDYEKTHGELRRALYAELRIVAKVSPVAQRKNFIHALARSEAKPTPNSIEAARISVSQSPFDSEKIERFKVLEEKEGKETLVAFLGARLDQLQGGTKK
jgi:tetratricopeptide (TPR) repeat protein